MMAASASAEEDEGKAAAAGPNGWPRAMAERYKHAVVAGQGMYGRVYAAWDSVAGELVAVKQLSGRSDGEFVVTGPGEFAQEVKALEACRGHPNVVKLLDTFSDSDDRRFIVTEFAGAMDLRRYVQRRYRDGRTPFAEDEVRDAMAQLLAGVARAHEEGLVHREIVPENVIVDDDHQQQQTTIEKKSSGNKKKACSNIKYTICGFNASERAGAAKDGRAHVAAPSPYRAPELFVGSKRVYDQRVDTWALGCVMAELVAGTGAPFFFGKGFDDDQVFKMMMRVVGGKGLVVEWPGLQRATTPREGSRLRREYGEETGRLRAEFPEKKLSQAGFDVLSGLLQSNPERRLTAAAALEMPWFRRRGRALGTCFASRGTPDAFSR